MSAPNPSKLDAGQVLQGSFDEATGSLRTSSTVVNSDIDVALDATEDNVAIADPAGDFLQIESDGSINVNSVDGALEVTQLNVLAEVMDINNKTNNNYGAATGAIRTASQIGNTTGAANFGAGVTDAQTLRTSSNITRNGTELSYNVAAPDANTLRVASAVFSSDANGIYTVNKESGEVASNSTTTPLLANATWTGTWVEASQYSCISFTIQADVDSATNGLRVQYSNDGVNIIRQSPATQLGSMNGVFYSLPIHARYVRLTYQNGPVNQTVFNVDCQLHEEFNGLAAVPISLPLQDTVTATTVKSVISGKSVDNVYTNQRATGVSTLNSTTTPLLANGVFLGSFEDILGYTNIALTLFSSHDSATDGFVLEYSTDGVNIDAIDSYSIFGGSVGTQFSIGVTARYFRIRYTNGAIAQSTFRLQCVYHISAPKPSSIRIEDAITGQNDAELQKAVITGKTPDGIYTNIQVQGIDSNNSSNTPLDANSTYRGVWFKWSEGYATLFSSVKSDVSGTLFIDASSADNPANGVETDVTFSAEIQFNPLLNPVIRRNTPLQSKWVRHRYVNGPAGQATFNLLAAFTTTDPGSTYVSASIMPTVNTFLSQSRSINTIPTADSTGYQDVPVDTITGNPKVTVSDIRDDILMAPLSNSHATQIVVGTTPVRLDTTQVTDRRSTMISNDGVFAASIGFSNAITFDTGSIIMKPGAVRVLPFDNSVQYWGIAQNTGGTQTTFNRGGSSASGTATNTGNALLSNNTYCNITANAQTCFVTGYTAGTANPLVSVKIGAEGNKQSGTFETVNVAEVITGATAGAGIVASGSLAGGSNQLYVAFVSRNTLTGTVTGVTGGGRTFTSSLTNITAGANRRIDVWFAYGTFSAGSVTANLSASTNAHITVYRITNANGLTPIQAVNSTTGNGTAVTGPTIAGTNKGYSIMAIAHTAASGTAAGGYTENSDQTNGVGANIDSLSTESLALVSTGSVSATYTLAGVSDWAAIGLTILPAAGNDPQITIGYDVSAVVGATSQLVTVSSASDATNTLDVTADRAWTVADIPNVTVRATGTNVGAAAANIDYLFMEITDTTGATTRISVMQGGKTVV